MKKILIVLFALVICLPVHAEITNAGFEDWLDGKPVAWSVIDSGVDVEIETTQVQSGAHAARVTVNTGRQSNTDFRQTITVMAGETNDFEVSVMHTEGGVRARLYVDGYRAYSDPVITNQWQTLAYSLTTDENRIIEVGLRFYDTRDFDGSEIVYLDDFKPGQEVTPPPPPVGCTGSDVKISLLTDRYGSETSWSLVKTGADLIVSGDQLENNTRYEQEQCLTPGEYTFSVDDSYGDGMCCGYGAGEFSIEVDGELVFSGGEFTNSISYVFTIEGDSSGSELEEYYLSATDLRGFELKTALHEIILGHSSQGYGALWRFYSDVELDFYYEQDGSILDIYSENPSGAEPYTFVSVTDQCGTYRGEGDCYNREHSFPRNWFGGSIEPMNSDVHHIYLSDGYVNSKRSNLPYGEVGSAVYISDNGSLVGLAASNTNYGAGVFEPIDTFKGDLARAQFYMATRYQNVVGNWESNSDTSDAVLNGNSSSVFEAWYLALLKRWHQQDPVSQKEIDRNNAAFFYQGNRNPFVDHPEFVPMIWSD